MPAPNRIVTRIGDLDVSAIILPEVPAVDASAIVCKACAPRKTRMKAQADLTQYGFTEDLHWTIFRCNYCKRQWALPYRIAHEKGGEE
jgi:aspartate carbamoyltransferase regulatory subunit